MVIASRFFQISLSAQVASLYLVQLLKQFWVFTRYIFIVANRVTVSCREILCIVYVGMITILNKASTVKPHSLSGGRFGDIIVFPIWSADNGAVLV